MRLEAKNNYAGEAQQQFNRPTDFFFPALIMRQYVHGRIHSRPAMRLRAPSTELSLSDQPSYDTRS
jgi:hypothetical protein